MVKEYLQGQLKLQGTFVPALSIEKEAKSFVERSYMIFLSDECGCKMKDMIPLLCASNQ